MHQIRTGALHPTLICNGFLINSNGATHLNMSHSVAIIFIKKESIVIP